MRALALEREPGQRFRYPRARRLFRRFDTRPPLLTREAFATYFRHLKPDGVPGAHVSQPVPDIRSVVERLALLFGQRTIAIETRGDLESRTLEALWVARRPRSRRAGEPRLRAASARPASVRASRSGPDRLQQPVSGLEVDWNALRRGPLAVVYPGFMRLFSLSLGLVLCRHPPAGPSQAARPRFSPCPVPPDRQEDLADYRGRIVLIERHGRPIARTAPAFARHPPAGRGPLRKPRGCGVHRGPRPTPRPPWRKFIT